MVNVYTTPDISQYIVLVSVTAHKPVVGISRFLFFTTHSVLPASARISAVLHSLPDDGHKTFISEGSLIILPTPPPVFWLPLVFH